MCHSAWVAGKQTHGTQTLFAMDGLLHHGNEKIDGRVFRVISLSGNAVIPLLKGYGLSGSRLKRHMPLEQGTACCAMIVLKSGVSDPFAWGVKPRELGRICAAVAFADHGNNGTTTVLTKMAFRCQQYVDSVLTHWLAERTAQEAGPCSRRLDTLLELAKAVCDAHAVTVSCVQAATGAAPVVLSKED